MQERRRASEMCHGRSRSLEHTQQGKSLTCHLSINQNFPAPLHQNLNVYETFNGPPKHKTLMPSHYFMSGTMPNVSTMAAPAHLRGHSLSTFKPRF